MVDIHRGGVVIGPREYTDEPMIQSMRRAVSPHIRPADRRWRRPCRDSRGDRGFHRHCYGA